MQNASLMSFRNQVEADETTSEQRRASCTKIADPDKLREKKAVVDAEIEQSLRGSVGIRRSLLDSLGH